MVRGFRAFLIVFMWMNLDLYAQDTVESSSLFSMGVGLHQAFVLVHSEDIRPVENSYPRGFQVDFGWQQRSLDAWNKCHCFPRIGASLQAWDFDNPDVLGYGMNAYFYIEPEFGSRRFISFSLRGGFGASLLTQPYDEVSNPENQSYSTHLAFSLILALKASLRISDRSRLELSPYYNHVSNGGVKKPNAGINYPSISLGYSHFLSDPDFPDYHKINWNRRDGEKRMDISPYLAWRQMEGGVHVFSPGIEIKGSVQIARINAITLGLEYLEDNFARYLSDQSNEDDRWRKLGTAMGHEFLLGRIIFSQQLGVYLYNPDWEGDALYQRWGFAYSWSEKLATGVNLKAHRNVADFIDFRLTYSL